MSSTKSHVDSMLRGYIDCALWSSTDDDDSPLDRNYSRSDIADSSLRSMRKTVVLFMRQNKAALADYAEHREYKRSDGNVWEHAGHDLWLTQNGHGTGFWDREYGGRDDIGKRLAAGAKKMGSVDMYVGDDGEIYVSPER